MALLPDALDAGVLEMRRTNASYAEGVFAAYEVSLDDLRRWLRWAQVDRSAQGFRAFLDEDDQRFEANEGWRYVLLDPASSDVLGWAGIRPSDDPLVARVGYWVRSDRTRRGYASAAARALTTAAFACLDDVERVEIFMDQTNEASVAVARTIGYHLDREVDFEPVTPGHSGRGFVWSMDRSTWNVLSSDAPTTH